MHLCHTIDYKGRISCNGQCLDPSVSCEGGLGSFSAVLYWYGGPKNMLASSLVTDSNLKRNKNVSLGL